MARCHYGGVWDFDARNISLENMIPSEAGVLQEAGGKAREVVDMALLHGWLQVADYGALLGLLTQPNAVPLSDGREALGSDGLYVELVRCPYSDCRAYVSSAAFQWLPGQLVM